MTGEKKDDSAVALYWRLSDTSNCYSFVHTMWIIIWYKRVARHWQFMVCLYTVFRIFSWGFNFYTSRPARRGSFASLLGLALWGRSLYFLINVRMMSWCAGDVYWVPRFTRAQSSRARVHSLTLLSWMPLGSSYSPPGQGLDADLCNISLANHIGPAGRGGCRLD